MCIAKWFSYTYTYIYSFSNFFPFRLLQNVEQSFLCYPVGPCWLSILNIVVCICQCFSDSKVMYGCESWIIKKAEHQRIDAFELRCWRRLLRVPQTARRSNQSILKDISPEYSLEGLVLKLKLQYFGHLMRRTDSLKRPWCWERLKASREGDNRGWDGWIASLTQWTWIWVYSRSWWRTGRPSMLRFMGS